MTPPVPHLPSAGRKEWTALAVLMLPLLLVSMDVSVLYFAVPFISQDLDPTATQQLWILDIYGFVLAGLLLTMGSLGDRIGRRRLLLIGALGFGLASVGAAYAPSAELLIAASAVLGIAGATLMPSTLALIRNMFHDDAQRSRAIAIWTGVLSTGVAIGPVLSGVLLQHFWWGSVFLVNIPAMLLLLVLGPVLLPEFRADRADRAGRFDILSAALSLLAVLPVIYGIKEWATRGFSMEYVALIGVGIAAGAIFVLRQRRISDPMLDLALFRRRQFSGSATANAVAMFALVGNAVFLTQYLQSVQGLSPLAAALWSLAPSVVVGACAPLAGSLGRRFDPAFVMAGGFLVAAVGFAVLTLVTPASTLAVVLIGAGVLSAGLVTVLTIVTEIAMRTIDPARAGSAAAVMETGSEFGGALGIAILGSVGAAIYAGRMAVVDVPGAVPDAVHAARETLAGATIVAAELPADAGSALLAGARDAFTAGMHGVAFVGVALMAATAVLCVAILRRPPVGGQAAGNAARASTRASRPRR